MIAINRHLNKQKLFLQKRKYFAISNPLKEKYEITSHFNGRRQ